MWKGEWWEGIVVSVVFYNFGDVWKMEKLTV